MYGMKRIMFESRLQDIIDVPRRKVSFFGAGFLLAVFGVISNLPAQTPITAGYQDFNYGTTVIATPTAEKPESKLWWNDGHWWGCLWSPATGKYRIHRFDVATQSWIDTGPDIDDRPQSLADALWDGQKLYVASHIYGGRSQESGNTTPENSARLYRYGYNAANDTYSLDAGFPVLVNSAESETLVLDKDSTGKLWVTWTQASKVYVNCSQGDDSAWGTPFAVPVQGANLDGDDISTLIAFDGKIGVMWSNQNDLKVYFAAHLDGDPDGQWQPRETALADENLGAVADDHLNIKLMASENNLYAVTKTSLSGSSTPRIFALKRDANGTWTNYVVANGSEKYTRPIVILDEENRELYVFAGSNGTIRMKKTGLSNINFPSGAGNVFIQSPGKVDINDPTASKQNVNSTTGLLLLASDEISLNYFHNYLSLPSSGPPTISAFTPASGPAGSAVTISGNNFNGAASVTFNGTPATNFTVDANTQITATVPAGATTGKIGVVKSAGSAFSANDFTVTASPQYTLTVNTAGSGSVALNPSGGVYDAGTVVALTAMPEAGFQFSGWSGDLTGFNNPETITMNANKNVTANFTAIGSGGQVVYEETQTGGSSSSATVTTSAQLTAASGHLYLAAIAAKSNETVTGVSGLGLNWTRVQAQCAGRNQTGVEVWMALGVPQGGSDGAVTATFASAPSNAVIAVSRYSGVDAVNPIGSLVAGNTNGVSGACSGGSDNSSYSFNLTTTMNGAVVYSTAAMRNRTHIPGAAYTERAEISQGSGGGAAAVAVQDQTVAAASTIAVDGSFSGNVDWAVIGFEIKPASGGGGGQYTLTVNASGSGSVLLNPPGGTYDAGAVVTLTANPATGYQFSGWSGDLSGADNPATITMDGNKNVTATFTPIGGSGQVVYEETQTGGSTSSATVTTAAALNGVSGHLYLAAIASKPARTVSSVSGLGLAWTLVKAQCAGRSQTGIEVWMAQGIPSGSGAVTAIFSSAPSAAVIAVSHYSGAETVNPLGNMVSGNTNGADGACSGGSDNNAYSFNLSTAVDGAMVYSVTAMRNKPHTPGAGYTERAVVYEGSGGSVAGAAVQDQSVASAAMVAVDGSFSGSVDWAVAAVEIRPQLMSKRGAAAANAALAPPAAFHLEQNYPNPFSSPASARMVQNPGTTINLSIPEAGRVSLKIYDVTGQLVRALVDGEMAAGRHAVHWNGRNGLGHAMAAGTYLYRIVVKSQNGEIKFAEARRMTVLK